MEKEDRERLKRILELTEKNNKIIRQMHATMRWGRVLKVIYWIVILGIAVGAFYFLQPVLTSVRDTYETLGDSVDSIKGSFTTIEDELEAIQ